MKKRDLIELINLLDVRGLGPTRIQSLIHQFGNPQDVFKASLKELCQVGGIDMKLAQNIVGYSSSSFAENQFEQAQESGVGLITLWDDTYPSLLKKIYDPPVVLFVKGSLRKEDKDSVAVVGARRATPYGKKVTMELSGELAAAGLTIVSGFARGIDTWAHQAAISAGGRTVAVLGSGLDITYPAENKKIRPLVEANGAVVSEFPFGTKPDAANFPRRNRVISGLCHATIVVEAGDRSGALLTAFNAVDQNRDVFAVPGRLTDRMSAGCLRLIRHGAIPVESSRQILEIINPKLHTPLKPVQTELKLDLSTDEMAVWSVLSDDPQHVDRIIEKTKLNPSVVLTILLSLELKGAAIQLSGKQFVKS